MGQDTDSLITKGMNKVIIVIEKQSLTTSHKQMDAQAVSEQWLL